MTRFSRVEFRPLSKKDDDEADEIVRQKSLKIKDAKDRDVSVGSKVMIPDPNEEGTVVRIDRGNVIVKMPQPYRMGPADEVECIRKCGRKAAAPKPKPAVRFAKTARKSRKRANNNNNNNDEKIKFLLKALKIHEASRAPAKSRAAPAKSRAVPKSSTATSRRKTARRSPNENEE